MNYQDLYDELMNEARSKNRIKGAGSYYEAHHIVPKCIGGEGETSQWRTHPNIVLLTAKEHFMAHYYLMKIHPNNGKMTYAFWRMCSGSGNQNRDYINLEEFAQMYSLGKSEMVRLKREDPSARPPSRKGIPAYNKGKKTGPQRPEIIAKRVAANTGKKRSMEIVAKQHVTISQYTLEGIWVRDWNSIKEAKSAFPGAAIGCCLAGKCKTSKGFTWKYK